MEYPMRVYGLNLFEYFLSVWLKWFSWLCLLMSVATFIFPDYFYSDPIIGAAYTTSLFFCFVLLGLAGAGIRQNKAVLDGALLLSGLTGIGMVVGGIWVGIVIVLLVVLTAVIRHYALLTRFNPRFFSLREFGTMIRIADTMIDGDGKEALHPIDIAISVDHMFSRISAPAAIKEIKLVMLIVEWLLPLLSGRPFPFSDLGTNERRMLVTKVINSTALFKNVAKVLKLFACAGYYGNPKGMAQVGYIPFDSRRRSEGKSQAPNHYPDPFSAGGKLDGKVGEGFYGQQGEDLDGKTGGKLYGKI
jgi:hypothetical protein